MKKKLIVIQLSTKNPYPYSNCFCPACQKVLQTAQASPRESDSGFFIVVLLGWFVVSIYSITCFVCCRVCYVFILRNPLPPPF